MSEARRALWLATTRRPRRPPLAGSLETEVAVVGAGITGLTAALLLQRAGLATVVLEANRVASGTSGSTSAHVTEVPDLAYTTLISRLGVEGALRWARASRSALDRIAATVEETRIACEFRRLPATFYSEDPAEAPELEADADAARRLGVTVQVAEPKPLPFAAAAIQFADQAAFHPVRYVAGLARALVAAGGRIHEGTRVDVWDEGEGSVRLYTGSGTVTARFAILATHTPIGWNLLQAEVTPYTSYLIAARLHDAVPDGLFWDTADPYHYLRGVRDRAGPLLLVGGEDHKTGQEPDPFQRFAALEAYARERFRVRAVPYRWSAEFFEPADGLPYVGRSPFHERLYVATGFAGVGLVQGTLAATLVQELIVGGTPEVSELLATSRLRPAAAGAVARESLDVLRRWAEDRLRSASALPGRLGRGHGAVLDVDGDKVAVYRDAGGSLHLLSPVCSHLGCLVTWNDAERTWDCPCHGGRYQPTGEWLYGPPTAALAPWTRRG